MNRDANAEGTELSDKKSVTSGKPTSSFKSFLKSLGPGLITGASDDDPSGIATYSQAGAQFGFGMLWMATFSVSNDDYNPGDVCKLLGLAMG